MRHIGGDNSNELDDVERERLAAQERQRRWIRYNLLPKQNLIALIHKKYGTGHTPALSARKRGELANLLILREDSDTARKEHHKKYGAGHEQCPTMNGVFYRCERASE